MRLDGHAHCTKISDRLAVQAHVALLVVDACPHLETVFARLPHLFVLADIGPAALYTPSRYFAMLASFRPTYSCRCTVFTAVFILEVHANSAAAAGAFPLAILAIESGQKQER